MRKILLTALTICLLSFASVAGAEPNYNFVRISDLTLQDFFYRMIGGQVYQGLWQQGTPIDFTVPERDPELDDPQNAPGIQIYASVFGLQGADPNGEVHFFVDPDGYVCALRILNLGDNTVSGMSVVVLMEAVGLSEQEIMTLASNPAAVAETWCQNAGRKIIRATNHAGVMMLLGASN